ncbi:hypothetical protein LCGC14_1816200, partial [marine sediment metagenome]
EERLDRAMHVVADPIIRTFYKVMKGRLLGAPEVGWAVVKKVLPGAITEEARGQTLEQALDEALGYDPSGFIKTVGEVGEFVGALATVKGPLGKLGTPVGIQQKAALTALKFGAVTVADETSKALAEAIDPSTGQSYKGVSAVMLNMAIGAVFSYLQSGVTGAWSKLKPTEQSRALKLLGLKKDASVDEIRSAAKKLAREYHPDKVAGLRSEFEKVISARDILIAERRGAVSGVIQRAGVPKQITGGDLTRQAPELAEKHLSIGDKIVDGKLVKGFEGTATGEIVFKDGQEQAIIIDALGNRQTAPVNEIDIKTGERQILTIDPDHLTPEEQSIAKELSRKQSKLLKGKDLTDSEKIDVNNAWIRDIESVIGRSVAKDMRTGEFVEKDPTLEQEISDIVEGEKVDVVDVVDTKKEINALKKQAKNTQKEMKIGDAQYRRTIGQITNGRTRTSTEMTKKELVDLNSILKTTDVAKNVTTESRVVLTGDTGSKIVSPDKNIAREQDIDRRRQMRNVKRTNKTIKDNKARGKKTNLISHFAPSRLAIAQFEEKTSIPVTYLHHTTAKTARLAGHNSREQVAKLLARKPADANIPPAEMKQLIKDVETMINDTSIKSNEQIKDWLFSLDRRAKVEPFMSQKDIDTAILLEDIFQNSIVAQERMEEVIRLWLERKIEPSNINDVMSKEQKKVVYNGARRAYADGRLKEFTEQLFINNVRFGLREYYFPAESEHTDSVVNLINSKTAGPTAEDRFVEVEPPSQFDGASLARRGENAVPIDGSVFAVLMNSFEKVSVRNATANDIKQLFNRYNKVPLGPKDKKYLDELYSSMLLKGELATGFDVPIQKLHALFWRTHLSLVTNPYGALKATTRNAFQLPAEFGGVVNVKAFV